MKEIIKREIEKKVYAVAVYLRPSFQEMIKTVLL